MQVKQAFPTTAEPIAQMGDTERRDAHLPHSGEEDL
jgi:hypothetical protein